MVSSYLFVYKVFPFKLFLLITIVIFNFLIFFYDFVLNVDAAGVMTINWIYSD